MVEWNPIKKSEIIIATRGTRKDVKRLSNPLEANSAIAVIGAKLGGWGKNLDTIAIKIIEIKKRFFLITRRKIYFVRYIFLLIYKS